MNAESPSPGKRKATFLAGLALYLTAIWFAWDTPALYPLKIFVVMLHEASHAVACVGTGGTVERIVLDPNQGGAAYCAGGNAFLILSAGYLGSLAWGLALLRAASAKRISSRTVVTAVGVATLALTLLYVRNGFGLAFGLAFGGALTVAGRRLGPTVSRVALTVLGLTSCLYAIWDVKSDVLDRPELRSDAAMLAEMTGVPTTAWGVIWIAIAVVVCALAFRREFRAS